MSFGGAPTIGVEIAAFVHEQRLGFHATVCPDGTANVSPKERRRCTTTST